MRKLLRLVGAVMAAITVSTGVMALGAPAPADAQQTQQSAQAQPSTQLVVAPQLEAELVQRLNALRSSKGLGPLRVDSRLVRLGRKWSTSMANKGQLSHNMRLPRVAPREWARLGENVGRGGSIQAIEDALVASPTHYRNLVDPRFQSVGIGVVVRGDVIYVTQQFMASGRRRR